MAGASADVVQHDFRLSHELIAGSRSLARSQDVEVDAGVVQHVGPLRELLGVEQAIDLSTLSVGAIGLLLDLGGGTGAR